MKLCRLWKIIIGKDEELAQAKASHVQAQKDLRSSTARLDAATAEATARASKILRRDDEAVKSLNDLETVAKNG